MAGYVAARVHAFYAFAKYAKAYERTRAPEADTTGPTGKEPAGTPAEADGRGVAAGSVANRWPPDP
nr:hypothetical protein [Lysobacter sp.]